MTSIAFRAVIAGAIILTALGPSVASSQSRPFRVLGDTTGAPPDCSAAKAIAGIHTFLEAFRAADSSRLAQALASDFVFSTGRFVQDDSFFVGRSVSAVVRYARKRLAHRERMTMDAVWFNGWRNGALQFGPVWFSRSADDLGRTALMGSGKGAFA